MIYKDGSKWPNPKLPQAGFIAVASGTNRTAYSMNGKDWLEGPTLPNSSPGRIACDRKGRYVVYGSPIAYGDGANAWGSATSPGGGPNIGYGGDKFRSFAGNNNVRFVGKSSDGINWTNDVGNYNAADYMRGVAVSFTGSLWVIMHGVTNGSPNGTSGNKNSGQISTDGNSWSNFTISNLGMEAACSNRSARIFLACADNSTIYSNTGPTGSAWAAVSSKPFNTVHHKMAYGNGRLMMIIVSSDSSAKTEVAYSTDPLNNGAWTTKSLPVYHNWTSLCYSEGVWVAVCKGADYCAYSLDNGDTWTKANMPFSADWYDVCGKDGR